jgi:hypothetical protein
MGSAFGELGRQKVDYQALKRIPRHKSVKQGSQFVFGVS